MNIEVEARPSYGMAIVELAAGEEFVAESSSMVAMTGDLEVSTEVNGKGEGGFLSGIKALLAAVVRKFLAGETLFVNRFTSRGEAGQVMLAPVLVGDVEKVRLSKGRNLTLQSSAFLGSGKDVQVSMIWSGWRMFFSGEGAFFLKCSGKGPLLINSFGAIEKVEVDGSYQVDGGHFVACEGDLDYKLKWVGGWKSSLLSGEGLLLEFSGKGTLWLQTRSLRPFLWWIIPRLPV